MNARDYLRSVAEVNTRIEAKARQVQSLRESLTQISAPMDKEQVTHTKNVTTMADTVARIVDTENEIHAELDTLIALKTQALSFLARLHPEQELLLTMRYIESKSIPCIAEGQGVSVRWIRAQIHTALNDLQAILDSEDSVSI